MMMRLVANRYLRLLLASIGVVLMGLVVRFSQPLTVQAVHDMTAERIEVATRSVGKRSVFTGEVRAQSSNALAAKQIIEVQTTALNDFARQRGGSVRLGDVYYHRGLVPGAPRSHRSVLIIQRLEIEVEDLNPHRVKTHLTQLGMTYAAHRISTIDRAGYD